ncbi:MAG TPA: nucleotide exchange factor GrpE [Candidatus Diapherotrites archaeon]|uniref:Protein GrpE n=1 Tax=Candidatus Iainarchaeum sp. TaxID=3101447 RepID=A0A7J4JNZ6_9ARCH|nr:nucleotide exchange factor GrpE [Candidatus Diapherotrites archaeon]HIH16926.1 nucleotide exchange factor GrpE [Candidatus Diapherotrites archaeon]
MKEGKPGKAGEPSASLAEDRVKELTETLQRLQAEFENASKRMERERNEFLAYANAAFVRELLPFVDSLEQAGNEEGVKLLRKQFLDILGRHGFMEIKCVGEKFDPSLHEVMLNAVDAGKPDGLVLEELQKGYALRDLVLRPSKVRVNKLS